MPTPQTPFSTHCPHALKTHFTQCQHLKPPFQLPPCPQNTFRTVPTPQTPFSTHPMPSKHISHSANTSHPLFNSPHAIKAYFTQCRHLKPPFQLTPCPQNTFHTVPTPQTPFQTHPVPLEHISHSANSSNPLSNCLHALKTHFTQCQHLKPPFQLTPCPQNIFQTVPTPQTAFPTAPMPSKHNSHSANTSNSLLNCPLALKTYFTQCQHLKPPFQLTPCPQNIFHTVPTPQTPFPTALMPPEHISHSANTSNPLFNSLPPCPKNTFHPMPTPQTPFPTAHMPSKHISHSANTSNPLYNSPHALKTYFTQCQHLTPPFQLTPCHQSIFHPMPTPQTPFPTHPMPSKHISHSANTSNPLSNSPRALRTYFTQCQQLKPPVQLPACPQNTFHTVPTPQTPFSTPPMPSKHISDSANTSNRLSNCPHALKTQFTQCQHLKLPFELPPCPQNIFHTVPTPQTPFLTHPMPSKHISHSANTSNPLFNCPHALKTHFTQCQHLKLPFELTSCHQSIFNPMPKPHTPLSTAPMPSKHISPSANNS